MQSIPCKINMAPRRLEHPITDVLHIKVPAHFFQREIVILKRLLISRIVSNIPSVMYYTTYCGSVCKWTSGGAKIPRQCAVGFGRYWSTVRPYHGYPRAELITADHGCITRRSNSWKSLVRDRHVVAMFVFHVAVKQWTAEKLTTPF